MRYSLLCTNDVNNLANENIERQDGWLVFSFEFEKKKKNYAIFTSTNMKFLSLFSLLNKYNFLLQINHHR